MSKTPSRVARWTAFGLGVGYGYLMVKEALRHHLIPAPCCTRSAVCVLDTAIHRLHLDRPLGARATAICDKHDANIVGGAF